MTGSGSKSEHDSKVSPELTEEELCNTKFCAAYVGIGSNARITAPQHCCPLRPQ